MLADTNRFNEAMELPTYVLEETPKANGTILRRGRGKAAGFTLEWEEKPYEWIHSRHFRVARVFTKGPFRRFGPVFDLEPVEFPDGAVGSKLNYALKWGPLTPVGDHRGPAGTGMDPCFFSWAATSGGDATMSVRQFLLDPGCSSCGCQNRELVAEMEGISTGSDTCPHIHPNSCGASTR